MAVTAWRLPGTVVAPGWTNPNNIKLVDSNFASKAVGPGGYSGVIRGEAFGFTTDDIPAGSTIDGIEAETRLLSSGTAYPTAYALYVQKVGGTNIGNNKASSWNFAFDASVPTRIAGGATDKWGVNPTASEAIASTFAVAYEFQNVDAKFSATGNMDSIRLRFHFTPPPAPTVTSVSPSSGATAGGTAITITGTDFTGATGVTIGGAAATSVTVVNATTITCVTPAGTAGAKDVIVTTASGSGTGTGLFTYTSANRPRRPGVSLGMRIGL